MTPDVKAAIDEIAAQFAGHALHIANDRQGGACVIVEDVDLGDIYANRVSFVGFHITHTCPYADTYPHFVRPDLRPADGKPLGEAMTTGHVFPQPGVLERPDAMPARAAVQVSRRSNRRDASGIETPLLKLLKVLTWIRQR